LQRLQFIPTDKLLIVACPGGIRSSKVVNLLLKQGFDKAVNLDGGLELWKYKGLPYIQHAHQCGCGCEDVPETPDFNKAKPDNSCGCC